MPMSSCEIANSSDTDMPSFWVREIAYQLAYLNELLAESLADKAPVQPPAR